MNRKSAKHIYVNPDLIELKQSFMNIEKFNKAALSKKCLTKKILLIGASNTGKTSIVLKFLFDFSDTSSHGPEENYYTSIKFKKQEIMLHIVDHGGIDQFTPLYTSKFTSKVDGYIYIYSTTDKNSYELIKSLKGKFTELQGKSIPSILVGNKCDQKDQRKVSIEEGKSLAQSFGIPFLEVSAKKHSQMMMGKIFEVLIREIQNGDKMVNSITPKKLWDEKKIDRTYKIFQLVSIVQGVLLTILSYSQIFGSVLILFAMINLLIFADISVGGVFLLILLFNGFLITTVSVLGSYGMKKGEKDCISVFTIISILNIVLDITCLALQYHVPNFDDFDDSPGSEYNSVVDPILSVGLGLVTITGIVLWVLSLYSDKIMRKKVRVAKSSLPSLLNGSVVEKTFI